ncbi:response regulator [Pseudoalteromonas tunicata]|uniref:Response regulator CheB (Receptor modification enzyme, protein-glutamate methylesterase) n=1 Tax=Pseudoalteromonas tunicata D2 TaxID=87626 RepID=A4CFQ2_9GAMM|nr:two-component system response regulator [Pseudoalteromonas tunicata]ATC94150.1 putative two-component system response regulator [Pseudoalteromonas tunicata]AXT29916.1 two-component system response regulator [Pseudoalteromonas tunicata]EAR26479.1 Response regulator CheB (receptor modification enzyme, protein-glutamate methylesterase) [Pseudoalteromonas tunicata D2]MDP4982581.1 two-component system response regulator [Pseudoalteromonas tunicata]
MQTVSNQKQTLLLVDDEPVNLRILKQLLHPDYQLIFAKHGEEALKLALQERPDLILLDIMMPDMTGFEVCQQLKQRPETQAIPVIFVTALSEEHDEAAGFAVGAVDYITKPISTAVVKARIKTHLSLVQADELRKTRLQVIQRLGRAAEYKDNETGTHVLRMSHYSKVIALAYGLSEAQADDLLHAAPMHDIGKIGIPDSIMLKPGKLTDDEFTIMKTHAEIGAEIIGEADSELLRLAKSVALTHHEKWDGTGYPNGLKGDAIPLEGRIVALADVFDALTSKRPYKEAWPIEQTMDYIRQQSGVHFEPKLVELFEQNLAEIIQIKARWQDV